MLRTVVQRVTRLLSAEPGGAMAAAAAASEQPAAAEPAEPAPAEPTGSGVSTDAVERSEDAAPPEAEDQGAQLFARVQASRAEVTRLERALEAIADEGDEQARSRPVTEASDVDAIVTAIAERDRRRRDLDEQVQIERNRLVLLLDVLLPHQQRARSRAQGAKQQQIVGLEAEDDQLEIEIGTLKTKIAEVQQRRDILNRKVGRLREQIGELEPKAARGVSVFMASADPSTPPSGVLVRASSWRRTIEGAKADGVSRLIVTVDETTGEVLKASASEGV